MPKILREYFIVKYILFIIPIYFSFVFFTFDQRSLLELTKIMSGYIAIFSTFFLSDEDMYFSIKRDIGKLLIYAGIMTAVFVIFMFILGFLDNIIISQLRFMNHEIIPLNLLTPISSIFNKFMMSTTLFSLCYFLNMVLLFIIIQLNVANKILEYIDQLNKNH